MELEQTVRHTTMTMPIVTVPQHECVVLMRSYCKVPVQKSLLHDLLPGPVTLVFQRSEELNADLNPFTSVCLLPELDS